MALYYTILLAITLGILIRYGFHRKEIDHTYFFGIVLSLFIITTIRECGYDYTNYEDIYLDCKRGIWDGQDIGFAILASYMPSYRALLFVMASFTFIPIYYSTKRLSPIPIFSILILYTTFFFPTIMGQMRQGASIFLIIAAYLTKDRKWLCLSLIVIALLMHTSAILGLIYFLPLKRRFNILLYLIIFITANFLGIYLENLLSGFMGLFESSLMAEKYDIYYATETFQGYSLGLNSAVIIRCGIFLLSYYILKNTKYENNQFLNLYFISIIFYVAFGFIPQIGGRGSLYFSILDVFLIPAIVSAANSDIYKLAFLCCFILLSILRFVQFFTTPLNMEAYIPYKFAF